MTLPVYRVDADALQAKRIDLDGDEGRHAVTVRRTRVGERIVLTDGSGRGAECEVVAVERKSLAAEVCSYLDEPAPAVQLVVAQAIPKGEHADRAVDLLTEIGVDRIVPWAADRNVVTWKGDRAERGLARWRATAAAAAKQSRRLRWPEVAPVASTDDLVAMIGDVDRTYVLHEEATEPPSDPPSTGRVLVIVGPEGGIAPAELDALTTAGALPTRLGPTVLRSSSAGMVAAAALLSRCRW